LISPLVSFLVTIAEHGSALDLSPLNELPADPATKVDPWRLMVDLEGIEDETITSLVANRRESDPARAQRDGGNPKPDGKLSPSAGLGAAAIAAGADCSHALDYCLTGTDGIVGMIKGVGPEVCCAMCSTFYVLSYVPFIGTCINTNSLVTAWCTHHML
jgi:hypothetical protein